MLSTIYESESKESSKESTNEIASIPLFELFTKLLTVDNELLNAFNINLTNDMKIFIKVILDNHPSIFSTIESTINKIVVDNKIDTKDIPELVVLVGKLYELLYKSKQINVKTAYFDIIKTLLQISFVLLVDNKNNDENNTKNISENAVKIIDACIELIKLKKTIKPKFRFC